MHKKQKPPAVGIFLVSISVICFALIAVWAGIEMNQQPPDPATFSL